MWPLILPSSSCFHESAIIRLLISSKKPNDKNMVWKKYIFILQMPSRTQQQQWLLSCTDILIYFIIWALHPSAFSGKATRWFSRKTHFKASDNRTGFLLFQIIVRLAPAVHLYCVGFFLLVFWKCQGCLMVKWTVISRFKTIPIKHIGWCNQA